MSLFGFLLVFTAACCHATWNLLLKRINAGPELVWLFSTIAMFLYLPAAAYVFIVEEPVIGLTEAGFIIGGALIHLGYFLLLQRGYRHGDLSIVYPTARATGPFLATIFAVLILGESLTPQIVVGGLSIVVGVLMLTGGLKGGGKQVTTSLLFGLAVGLLIGVYTVWDAYAVSVVMISPIIFDYPSSITRSLVLAPIALRRKERVAEIWRRHKVAVLAIAVLNPLAYILVLYAMTFTPVVYVAPTRELSVLITVVLGGWLLREADLKRRLGWSVLILIGVATLATG